MVISASRRTDIPAFYGEWFMHRLDAGYCEVANPFNPDQISRISLAPEDVDAIVFWTRYPRTLLDRLEAIRGRGYPLAFLYTVVDYPRRLEPASPPLQKRIGAFRTVVDATGPRAAVWRYDPIIVSNLTPPAFHRERFARIADALSGYVDRVIISLLQPYRSVMRALGQVPGLDLADHGSTGTELQASAAPGTEILVLLRDLAADAAERGLTVQSCADPRVAAVPGIEAGACISEDLIQAAGAATHLRPRAANQRTHCRCLESRDIGAYETCLFGCRYCYATHGTTKARENARRHDPTAGRLVP
ncbi:MAG: DUF1848 domain-containing protein [Spirochaetaceae bacterium]